MKKFILAILKYILILSITLIIFTFIFSTKNNITIAETISYFQIVIEDIVSSKSNANSKSVIVNNTNIDSIINSIDNYYYNQLDDTAKIIYASLEANIDNLKKENFIIDFSTAFNDLLHKSTGQFKLSRAFQSALDAFFYDHPELFYLELTKITLNTQCISIGSLTTYLTQIIPLQNNTDKNVANNYLNASFNSEEEVEMAIKNVEDIKKEIINKVSDYSTYNKIKAIHDILVNSIEYDETYSKTNTHNIYGAFIEKEVVCEGYAKAFKYIVDSLDIECILVSGNVEVFNPDETISQSHMWNYVNLNNNWYGVDLTWDDPIIIGGDNKNNIRHDYLLKGSYIFNDTHTPSGKITSAGMLFHLPDLSTINYN